MAQTIETFFKIDGMELKSIGREMMKTVNQLSYQDSQGITRSVDGSMTNLPDQEYFVLPSVEIGFRLISIEDYLKLKALLLRKQIFDIEYYDKDFCTTSNPTITHRMYAHPDQLLNFMNFASSVTAVRDLTLTFVATLTETDEYTIELTDSGSTVYTASAKWGRSILLPYSLAGTNYKKFQLEVASADIDITYSLGDRITIFENATLKGVS